MKGPYHDGMRGARRQKSQTLVPSGLAAAIALDLDDTSVVETARKTAQRLEIDPFEILLKFAAGDIAGLGMTEEDGNTITPGMRLAAAIEATQYIHPKKRPTDLQPASPTGEMAAVVMPSSARRERLSRLRSIIDVTPSQSGKRE